VALPAMPAYARAHHSGSHHGDSHHGESHHGESWARDHFAAAERMHGALIPAVRAAMHDLDPSMLMVKTQPLPKLVERAQAGTRFSLLLIGVFAVIAALLASIGLYGVLATFVRQRTAEIGVRMALGAAPSNIITLVVGHGLSLSAVGIGAGIIAALVLTRLMTTMLVGVPPTDPLTYFAVIALFLAIAALSCLIPALRAAGPANSPPLPNSASSPPRPRCPLTAPHASNAMRLCPTAKKPSAGCCANTTSSAPGAAKNTSSNARSAPSNASGPPGNRSISTPKTSAICLNTGCWPKP